MMRIWIDRIYSDSIAYFGIEKNISLNWNNIMILDLLLSFHPIMIFMFRYVWILTIINLMLIDIKV